jgi:hypothetical protein
VAILDWADLDIQVSVAIRAYLDLAATILALVAIRVVVATREQTERSEQTAHLDIRGYQASVAPILVQVDIQVYQDSAATILALVVTRDIQVYQGSAATILALVAIRALAVIQAAVDIRDFQERRATLDRPDQVAVD